MKRHAVVLRVNFYCRLISISKVSYTLTRPITLPSNCSSRYRLMFEQLALAFSRLCQPSTSLLVQILQWNTDQLTGSHTVDSAQVE